MSSTPPDADLVGKRVRLNRDLISWSGAKKGVVGVVEEPFPPYDWRVRLPWGHVVVYRHEIDVLQDGDAVPVGPCGSDSDAYPTKDTP